MIRRDVIRQDRDQGAVKWLLLVSAFALSVGLFAEVTLERHSEDAAATTSQTVQVAPESKATITG